MTSESVLATLQAGWQALASFDVPNDADYRTIWHDAFPGEPFPAGD